MKNKEVASMLYEIAELLSLTEENPFRIRAYEKAAQTVESLPKAIEDIAKEDKLQDIPGIGESVAEKIQEYLQTGSLKYLDELKKSFPEGLIEIMSIPGMGPKKAKVIYDKLKISSVEELRKSAKEGKLRNLPGFGAKTEENILKGIELKEKSKGRMLLFDALSVVRNIVNQLKKYKEVKQISPAGSLRRKKETIGDIDILCTVEKNKEKFVIDKFTRLPEVQRVLASGDTKASVITTENLQVDIRVVDSSCYGSALMYFTGSKEHNIALRELANKKGLTISEYGVFKIGDKTKALAGRTEEEIYKLLGIEFIPPELRENRGEIEPAKTNSLPQLIQEKDIKGDIHVHSKYSDGADNIKQIADACAKMNYEWVIIADHSQSLKVAKGVSIRDLRKKIDEIKEFNSRQNRVKLLCGQEVDILPDGKLDYPDEILRELDFVIAAIHTGFKQSEEQMTNRIIKSFQNKYVHAFAHPTGRLIGEREGYAVNLDKVLEEAKKCNIIIEINAFPQRLDLQDIYCKKAKELGIKLAIGTDAHSVVGFYAAWCLCCTAWLVRKKRFAELLIL
ncbi:MAG: DNA polymerase/3'-5' exonuclease PolX [Elusimicrobiota bacterium]|nr:DNA polymerase/3'-5' exonuclease PolX [Elusimicrobiota bacterium]